MAAEQTSIREGHPGEYGPPVLAVAALGVLAAGLFLPVVTVDRLGPSRDTYSVLAGVVDLARRGELLIAFVLVAFSVVFPIVKLLGLLVIWFRRLDAEQRERTLHLLKLLGKWSMLDFFVVVIVVGAVQLGILAEAEAEIGAYVFASGIILSILATFYMAGVVAKDAVPALSASQALHHWGLHVPLLAALALVLLIAGILLPLMTLEEWIFWDRDYSVLVGTIELFNGGDYLLALAVLVFVVAIPSLKFLALLVLSLLRAPRDAEDWRRRWLLALDKWSMVDVFGLAALVVFAKVGGLASVEPRAGLWFLAGTALLSVYLSWRIQ
jgi:paraquat-inducible protein A